MGTALELRNLVYFSDRKVDDRRWLDDELKAVLELGLQDEFLSRVGKKLPNPTSSALAYVIGITDEPPTRYPDGLQVVHGKPPSMADIDLDMSALRRDEVVQYAARRFGEDRVAQIITFQTIKARAAVRDAARVMGYPFVVGDKIAKAMPPMIMGRDAPLDACFNEREGWEHAYQNAYGLRELYATDDEARQVIDAARALEGLRRGDSIHAAAVVISDVPLTDIVPVQRRGEDQPIVTQYDMHAVEELGLLKMDFLGLRNLDVITECQRLIVESGGFCDIDNVPLDDAKTFDLLCRGETVGVFQLESKSMQELAQRLQPDCFEDIAALVALYRPGPMAANMHNDYADRKNGRQPVTYFHEDARDLLADTYGLMIYQESVMEVARRFAGYSMAEADLLRKAMGKKRKDVMADERDKFVQGCVQGGYEEGFAVSLFSTIEKFSDYAFCKAHAFGYGYIAYQTAYLKANYPTQYMAALCTAAQNLEKASVFLAEARRMGIEVKLPSVNHSLVSYTATQDDIRMGLTAIAQVGAGFAQGVVENRQKYGPFSDVYDFVLRMIVDDVKLNSKVFVALIEAGCFDEFGVPRLGLIGVVDEVLKAARKEAKAQKMGQVSMFDAPPEFEIPDVEYSAEEKLALEKKVMGIYVSGHPMDGLDEWVAQNTTAELLDLLELPDERLVWVAGLVSNIELKRTRGGEEMAHFLLEDHDVTVRVTAFPKNWGKFRHLMEEGGIYRMHLRVTSDNRGERDLVLVNVERREAEEAEEEEWGSELRLYLPSGFYNSAQAVSKLKGILLSHRGRQPVILHLSRNSVVNLPEEYGVRVSDELLDQVRTLFRET